MTPRKRKQKDAAQPAIPRRKRASMREFWVDVMLQKVSGNVEPEGGWGRCAHCGLSTRFGIACMEEMGRNCWMTIQQKYENMRTEPPFIERYSSTRCPL